MHSSLFKTSTIMFPFFASFSSYKYEKFKTTSTFSSIILVPFSIKDTSKINELKNSGSHLMLTFKFE